MIVETKNDEIPQRKNANTGFNSLWDGWLSLPNLKKYILCTTTKKVNTKNYEFEKYTTKSCFFLIAFNGCWCSASSSSCFRLLQFGCYRFANVYINDFHYLYMQLATAAADVHRPVHSCIFLGGIFLSVSLKRYFLC